MDIKTYFDKTNTIIYNSTINTAKNPVCELYYGDGYTRVLIDIDTSRIASLITDKTFSDVTKLTHILKMKNCWGLQTSRSNLILNSGKSTVKERTSSFDLYLLRMPETWDSGVGNDFTIDGFITNTPLVSENGSNWYNSGTQIEWTQGSGAISGITSGNTVCVQHFDIGNEDIEMDITDEINSIIAGAPNYGFMLCFPKLLEDTSTDITQYVGFFTNNTSTFFKPYLETIYQENIVDDRNDFYAGKENKLYFYSVIGGSYTNLDAGLICTVNSVQYNAQQATKGIYYVVIPASVTEHFTEEQMYYDNWSGISYNGKTFDDVELEFVVKPPLDYFNFGNGKYEQPKYVPTIYGVKFGEKISSGEVRKVHISPRVEYTSNVVNNITGMEYKIYVKETNKEIVVIDYQPVNRTLDSNFFLIDTLSLLPNTYYVDIKIVRNDEEIIHKNRLTFEIINEL